MSEGQGAVERVVQAWTDCGPVPAYHFAQQLRLRREWPTLASAIEELARQTQQEKEEA